MNPKSIFITREVEFSSAHRLYRDEFSDAKNFELFGKCANPFGHGHNYMLQVTVRGTPGLDNQMVVHFSQLKRILDEVVVLPLDHRHLNHDVPFLEGILPTSENLVVAIWNRLTPQLESQSIELYKLRLSSSSRNWVEYYGEDRVGQ